MKKNLFVIGIGALLIGASMISSLVPKKDQWDLPEQTV